MRYQFLLLFSILTSAVTAVSGQKKHQFIIISENDSYISINKDGYYTNGIKLAYQWRKSIAEKKRTERVNSIYAGHNIYNSRFSAEVKTEKLDRPITGYLYGGYQKSLYNEKQDLLRWGVSAGVIGPPARGAEVQKLAHKIAKIYEPTYWDRQLKAAWGFNADITWAPQIISKTQTSKWDFKPLFTASAGTLFTNAGAGGALVYGKFNKNSASAFWNNHQQTSKAERELFIYLLPMIYLKAYDATVQGGMFRKEIEKIPGKLNPVFFQNKLGVTYACNKLTVGITAIYENRQSLTQFSSQYYGSLQVGWMW